MVAGAVAVIAAAFVPAAARADIINPGAMIGGYLYSPVAIAAALVLAWPAVQIATGRPWRRSAWCTLAVKAPTILLGPVLLLLTGGFVVSFAPVGLAANVAASSLMYALLDIGALQVFLRTRPTWRGFAALYATNLLVLAVAMIVFVTVDHALWLRIRE